MSILSFGSFLLSQKDAGGSLGELAQAAAKDPSFPREGGPRDVSQLLNRQQAPGEYHDALEEAEAAWRELQ